LQAAGYADELAEIATLSAALLFACSSSVTADASAGSSGEAAAAANPLFNTRALQLWILRGCQQLKGGLRDKPGKSADYYHTCYCLSGLSAAQHIMGGCVVGPRLEPGAATGQVGSSSSEGTGSALPLTNQLVAADPLLNVVVHRVAEARHFFATAEQVQEKVVVVSV
jgi:protein farnesyltransferase subunit beta